MLNVTPDQVEKIHGTFKTNRERIEEDVKILEEWLKKQPHLPQNLPFDGFLERILANSQYRVEFTKNRIEKHFTLKRRNKDLYQIFSEDQSFLPSKSNLRFVPMPKLGPGLERIYVGHLVPDRKYNTRNNIQQALSMLEFHYRHDQTNMLLFVGDCRYVTELIRSSVSRADFALFFRVAYAIYTTYTTKMVGFHFINVSSAFQMLISMVSSFVKPKLLKRIHIHDSIESLHKAIDEKYLPKEFGGTAGSMIEIEKKLDDFYTENRSYLMDLEHFTADDDKRIGDCKSDKMFGVSGTFKNLNLD